jgi:hypothetical protein
MEIKMEDNMAINEHHQIQEIRKMWSGAIMDWMKVGIPVGGAIFGLFSYLSSLGQFKESCSSWLPLLGWVIFIIPIVIWRFMAHHIDRNIVDMYPRILELEHKLQWDIHAPYVYYNLRNRKPRKYLESIIKEKTKDQKSTLKDLSYKKYVEKSKDRDNAYKSLLEVFDKYKDRSVTSRSHIPQDWAAGLICTISLAIALLLVNSL